MATDGRETVEQGGAGDVSGILKDGVLGAAGGFVGTALMTVVLLVGTAVDAFDIASFASLAALINLDAFFSPALTEALGYFIFLGGGMTTWPLLFAAVERYLPGVSRARRGIAYGTVLWTGFALAFYNGYPIAQYAVVTLVAHWAYGFGLGTVFDYFIERQDTLV